MKVKMLVALERPENPFLVGQVVEVPDQMAVAYIQAGYASPVIEAPAPIDNGPTQNSIEAELTALGVYFVPGADLGSLIALRDARKAPAKPNKPAKALPAETLTGE